MNYRTIYKAVKNIEQAKNAKELPDLFAENPRLIISPNNKCFCSCLHCVADSNPNGITIPYSEFVKIDKRFIKI